MPLTHLDRSLASLERTYPGYRSVDLDDLRARDFTRLDRHGDIYLDYTGGGLHAESHLRAHAELLNGAPFGNPHSTNPTSLAMTELVEGARATILQHFHADPAEYLAIFTANASGALKIVGESYPFEPGGRYALAYDNHNSVNGIREFARARGAAVDYLAVRPPEMRLDREAVAAILASPSAGAARLLAFPAQSNFSGVMHPLELVMDAQGYGWDVLLDAAAFAPTHLLDLRRIKPQFVSLSFYKMFGFPTGVGALLARRDALPRLRRPWVAGGTISYASVLQPRHDLHEGAEAFEDGTLNYLAIPAVATGLARLPHARLAAIEARVGALTHWTLEQMKQLQHPGGAPLIDVYGPWNGEGRGGSIAFNVIDRHGRLVDHREVEARANTRRISLRTGCFCNPGAGEAALGISSEELASCFRGTDRMTIDTFRGCLVDKGSGAVRISYGVASVHRDALALLELLDSFVA